MLATRRTCTDPKGGRVHCWRPTGLDPVDGILCHTGECVWCHATAARPYLPGRSTPIRPGCRVKP